MKLVLSTFFLLAGCYDFSLTEHGDFAAVGDAASSIDFARPDSAASNILIDEPFATLSWERWSSGGHDSAFSIDTTTTVDGDGALEIDVSQVSVDLFAGQLKWKGALPTDVASRHLRYYIRFNLPPDRNVDTSTLSNGARDGIAITLTRTDAAPNESVPVANQFVQDPNGTGYFDSSEDSIAAGAWHCIELALEPVDASTWRPALWIDGIEPSVTFHSETYTSQPSALSVGFGMAQVPQFGTQKAWIDAVVMTEGGDRIGCPYGP